MTDRHKLSRVTPASSMGGGFAFCKCGVKLYGQTVPRLHEEFAKHKERVGA